jgi:hypothetical protein
LIFRRENFDIDGKVDIGLILESLFLECIGRIGKQFTHEDLTVGIERFGDDVQQFFGLCFELHLLRLGMAEEG